MQSLQISLSTLTTTYLFVLVRGEYRRPFGYGLLVSASVRPHRMSGHEADSLTCDHLSNRPSYCQNNPYNDETFDESFHTGDYLFIWSISSQQPPISRALIFQKMLPKIATACSHCYWQATPRIIETSLFTTRCKASGQFVAVSGNYCSTLAQAVM